MALRALSASVDAGDVVSADASVGDTSLTGSPAGYATLFAIASVVVLMLLMPGEGGIFRRLLKVIEFSAMVVLAMIPALYLIRAEAGKHAGSDPWDGLNLVTT